VLAFAALLYARIPECTAGTTHASQCISTSPRVAILGSLTCPLAVLPACLSREGDMFRIQECRTSQPASHAGQVIPIVFVQMLCHSVERSHLDVFQLSLKRGSKCLYRTCCNRMPLIDPPLDCAAVMRIVFDHHPDQSPAPFSMPSTIFVERIEH
jgi:hypothetical protein